MPPSNRALLLVFKSLFLVQEAILLLELALDDNPSPDHRMELEDQLADLTALKDELVALRDAMENGSQTIPSPDPSALAHVRALVAQVEAAKNAGLAAGAVVALAGDVLSTGLSVMSLARS
jgi:hypothetical protein